MSPKQPKPTAGIDHKRTLLAPANQPLSERQLNFLQRVAAAIPRLFAALAEGNVKSELILGLRRVRNRQARLKLVAELVDPGSNPLKSHGSRESDTGYDGQGLEERSSNSEVRDEKSELGGHLEEDKEPRSQSKTATD